MNNTGHLTIESLQDKVSAQEWQLRQELAACYRLVAHLGWDDLIFTHISCRVPTDDNTETFLINPMGLCFEEITASSLLKIDIHGNKLLDSSYPANKAGFIIHSAVHASAANANCVLHLHTTEVIAVASTKQGLLPLSQTAIMAASNLAYHDYEGLATRDDEKERLVASLGDKKTMFLRNHGALTTGATVSEAFTYYYNLQFACKTQLQTLAMGQELSPPQGWAIENTERDMLVSAVSNPFEAIWKAMMRKMIRLDASFLD